jgi:hypothetical protein
MKRWAIAAAAVWLALFVAFLAYVSGDEDLRPEVAQALVWRAPANAFENNGYLIALGIQAPASRDPAALGSQVLHQELERFESLQSSHQEPPMEPASPARVDQHMGLGELGCVYTAVTNCVDFYLRQNRAQLEGLLAARGQLTDRYEAIWQAGHYTEVVPPLNTVAASHFQVLRDASELQRMQAVLDIASNRMDVGLNRFATNAARSRQLLRESNTLISHMVALAFVHRDIRVWSELLRRYPSLAKDQTGRVDEMLEPISGKPYRLSKGFEHERALRLHVLKPLEHADAETLVGPGSGWFAQRFAALNYLPHATLNDAHALSGLTLKLAEADASAVDAVKQEIRDRYATYLQIDHTFFTRRNATGRTLNAVGQVDFSKYVELQHDLNTFIAMVLAQRAWAAGIPAGQVALPLNPYTGLPMRQDAATGDLVFEGRQASSSNPGKSNQYRVPLR